MSRAAEFREKLTGRTVLIVEDDSDVRRMLELSLNAVGMKVTTAACNRDARSVLAHEPVEILILDWNMPDESGLSFVTDLARGKPELFTNTLVITGDLLRRDRDHQAARLGRPVLSKPFKQLDLYQALFEMLSE